LSASLLASPPLFGSSPCETSHPSGRPSPSLSALVISVPCDCSSALVRPSPSQSAPPSDGSRGSVPSPLTTDEAVIRTRNSATSMLRFFWLFIFISLPIFFCKPFQRTHCSLFPGLASFSDVFSGRICGFECLRWDLSRISVQKYGAVSRFNGSSPSSIFPCSTLFMSPIAANSVTVHSREPGVPSNLPLVVALYQEYD
jgi:hypothetical protein